MGSRLSTVGDERRRTASDVGGVVGAREDRGPEEQPPPGLRRLREQGRGIGGGGWGKRRMGWNARVIAWEVGSTEWDVR